jgi:hypothetical protein
MTVAGRPDLLSGATSGRHPGRVATRHRQLRIAALSLCGALVLAACASEPADEPGAAEPVLPDRAVEASFVSLDVIPGAVEAAVADAAERFGVPRSEVAVAGALRVKWADLSLGCPEPDMMYAQVLVDGYRLTLEVAGQRIEYHGADGEPPFLCER